MFDDDCGIWSGSRCHETTVPYRKVDDDFKRLFLKDGVYCFEKFVKRVRTYVPYEPQPAKTELVHLCRYYATQKSNDSYKRRISWLVVDEGVSFVAIVGLESAGCSAEGDYY